jgi:hypothetical protein
MLTARFGLRFVALAVVRRLGYRSTMAAGVTLAAAHLSRRNSDWHRVIELCAVFRTLIADEDGI